MIEGLFSDSSYLAAKRVLDFTALRQEAIASNLANVDTPNYKRLDVSPSFENQLKEALATKDPEQIASVQPELMVDTQAQSGRSDGNTVQLETEMLKLNQNMVEHALGTQLVTYSISRMRTAITGKE